MQKQFAMTFMKISGSILPLLVSSLVLFAGPSINADDTKPKPGGPLPEGLHGFSGHLTGKLVSKDVEKGSLVMKVRKVLNVWKGNKASQPTAAEGRTLAVTGIHGPALDVVVILKPGDHFEIETKHVRGDDMVYLGEGIKKVTPPDQSSSSSREVLHGFKGMFIGELMAKDQEKGTLSVKIEEVTKVWEQNQAPNAKAAAGQTWKINNVAGKWLDTLLVLKVGDRVEVEAFHRRGDELDFVGEWLKKLE